MSADKPSSPKAYVPLVESKLFSFACDPTDDSAGELALDVAGQSTLRWDAPIRAMLDGQQVTVPAASCNMYTYPRISLRDSPKDSLNEEQRNALDNIIFNLASDATCVFADLADQVGAYPIHTLLVANTDEAVDLARRIIIRRPKLLMQAHGVGPFIGENSVHVLCANAREAVLVDLLRVAGTAMSKDEQRSMLTAQTEGVFFSDSPMDFYGGTPVAYAAVFSLKRGIKAMLEMGVVGLNDEALRCCVSGFLPLHAVVANGLKHMYDWLTCDGSDADDSEALPREWAADPTKRVAAGRLDHVHRIKSCSPMQLAGQLGDRKTFVFLLRKQTNILWRWGPVTKYEIDLHGIDSAGETETDVMEIIGTLGAKPETTKMLLDSFMKGFIHELFVQKWARFGMAVHYFRIGLQLLHMGPMVYLVFSLKADPESCEKFWTPLFIITMIAILIEEEMRVFYLWWRNQGGEWATGLTRRQMSDARSWLRLFQVDLQIVGYICGLAACTMLLLEGQEEHVLGRLLRAGGRSQEDGMEEDFGATRGGYGYNGHHAATLLLFSLATFAKAMLLTAHLLIPFQRLGVFMLSVNRMLRNDILTFMILFTAFITMFYFMLFIVYPRAGEATLSEAPAFNDWLTALQAMTTLAFMGESLELELGDFGLLSPWQQVDMLIFVGFYIFYVLMSIILLLNLLIAMLGFTFTDVYESSTLEWRLMFAQYVLRLELLADASGLWELQVGEKEERESGMRFVYTFIDVLANAEGEGASGNPFEDEEEAADGVATFIPAPSPSEPSNGPALDGVDATQLQRALEQSNQRLLQMQHALDAQAAATRNVAASVDHLSQKFNDASAPPSKRAQAPPALAVSHLGGSARSIGESKPSPRGSNITAVMKKFESLDGEDMADAAGADASRAQ